MPQLAIRAEPAVAQMREAVVLKFRPREMQEQLILVVEAAAWNTGRVDQRHAATIAQQTLAQATTSLQSMVHMTKHHEIRSTGAGHPIKGQGKVLVPPINRRGFPVTSTGTVGV